MITQKAKPAMAALILGFSADLLADVCKPVAYVFRHGEERGGGVEGNNLYPVGNTHAGLYPAMLESFKPVNKNYCPVRWVYAVSIYKPDGSLGTSNPYYTALPLAESAMGIGANPITKIGNRRLGEFLENGERNLFVDDIRSKLSPGGSSVAIFWTRQGMGRLAQALFTGGNIPVGNNTPRRNSMYIFKYDVQNKILYKQSSKWIQCFNFDPYSGDFSDSKYHCLNSGNLLDIQQREKGFSLGNDELANLRGKICDSEELDHLADPLALFQGSCTQPN
ncbi:MAG: hypothetical protein ACKN9W_03435 [Methylococcus sp.]